MTHQPDAALCELRREFTAAMDGTVDVAKLTAWTKDQLKRQMRRLSEGVLPSTAPHEHAPLVLAHAEDLMAILHHYRTPSDLLYWIPRRALYLCLAGDGAIVSYAVPDHVSNGNPTPTNLQPGQTQRLRRGEFLVRRERTHVTDVQPGADFVVLAVLGPAEGPLHWVFERDTLSLRGLVPDDLKDTQVELLCSLGGRLGDEATADSLLAVLKGHWPYYVKWSALKGLNALNSAHLAEALECLARDDNEEISSKARALLAQHQSERHARAV